jgi:lysophospholipase L1-like esterase
MQAGGVAIPDLQRAAAPVIENVRQACGELQLRPGRGQATYVLLMNLRAYLTLADAVPKPFPFPDTAQRQLTEVREGSSRLDAHFRALLESKDTQLVTADPDNRKRYADANRRLPQPSPAKLRVVFYGDSITDFWRLNEYFPESDYVNRGISGQTTGQMLGRTKPDVIDLRPQAVLILAGTNDLARNVPLTEIEDNYLMMADMLAASRIKVIFASVLPVSDYHKDQNPSYERTPGRPPAYIKALNDWLQSLCAQRGFTYLDYYSSMIDTAGLMQRDLADDGLHPNSKGYRIMAPLANEAIARTLGPAEAAKPRSRRPTSK